MKEGEESHYKIIELELWGERKTRNTRIIFIQATIYVDFIWKKLEIFSITYTYSICIIPIYLKVMNVNVVR